MYDRAPREWSNLIGSTPHNVGPGSYDQVALAKSKLKADGYAPFLSMTSRDSFLNVSDQLVAAPGPGHYDPGKSQDYVKGGRTMANKSKRFGKTASDTPGPGAYKVDFGNEFRAAKSAPEMRLQDKSGALVNNRIKFYRKPEAPSIPCPGQAYGYEEFEDGTLKKQDPPEKDHSLGPAYYQTNCMRPREEKKTGVSYKGVHFGKQTSKRSEFVVNHGPGPGEYDPYHDQQFRPENANIQEEERRYEINIPRYIDSITKGAEKTAIPGPGKYDVRGQFDPQQPKVNTDGIEVEHPPFMSQSKRFQPLKNLGPAPGSYNDPRSAMDTLKRVTGLKRSPFGQTSVRFNSGGKRAPGPGAYNISGMGSDSMRKAYMESTRRGVFGTTSTRIQATLQKEEVEKPGPAHYQVREKMFQSRYQQLSSNFASVTSRLTEVPDIVKDNPAPGSYDVIKAYEKSQVKQDRLQPRSEAAKRKHGSFMSAASRFAPPRDIIFPQADADIPGPGTYAHSTSLNKKGALIMGKGKRFTNLQSDVPGPGAYELSPLVQDSVLKGTFNSTLNNPFVQQVESVPQANTSVKHAFLLGV